MKNNRCGIWRARCKDRSCCRHASASRSPRTCRNHDPADAGRRCSCVALPSCGPWGETHPARSIPQPRSHRPRNLLHDAAAFGIPPGTRTLQDAGTPLASRAARCKAAMVETVAFSQEPAHVRFRWTSVVADIGPRCGCTTALGCATRISALASRMHSHEVSRRLASSVRCASSVRRTEA